MQEQLRLRIPMKTTRNQFTHSWAGALKVAGVSIPEANDSYDTRNRKVPCPKIQHLCMFLDGVVNDPANDRGT
jgi:hypothetical protein